MLIKSLNSRIQNVNIQAKLFGAVLIIFVLGIALIGWTVWRLSSTQGELINIFDRSDELLYLQDIEILFRELEGIEKDAVLAGDFEFYRPVYDENADALYASLMDMYKQASNRDIRMLMKQLLTEFNYQTWLYDDLAALYADDPEEARLVSSEESDRKIDRIYQLLYEQVFETELDTIHADFDSVRAKLSNARVVGTVTIFLFVLVGLAALGIILLIGRQIVRPMLIMADVAEGIEKENFAMEPLKPFVKRGDEIGKLARVFDRMAREMKTRVELLKNQVTQLQIVIDQNKLKQQVTEITDNDYFQNLQARAKDLRAQGAAIATGEAEPASITPPPAEDDFLGGIAAKAKAQRALSDTPPTPSEG